MSYMNPDLYALLRYGRFDAFWRAPGGKNPSPMMVVRYRLVSHDSNFDYVKRLADHAEVGRFWHQPASHKCGFNVDRVPDLRMWALRLLKNNCGIYKPRVRTWYDCVKMLKLYCWNEARDGAYRAERFAERREAAITAHRRVEKQYRARVLPVGYPEVGGSGPGAVQDG